MGAYSTLLMERFTELRRLPKVDLLRAPTPVERLPALGREIGYEELWIKRDDQSAEPYGGNKPRKLELSIGDILDKGARAVVTFGGIGTNHGLATAIYARRFGLKCHLVLVEQPVDEHVRQNLRLFHAFGASLHLAAGVASAGFRAARLLIQSLLDSSGGRARLLGPGGTSPLTTLGFVNAAFELKEQIDRKQMPVPSHIFLPAGTGGTMAGLLLGLKLCGLPIEVIGVRAVDSVVAAPAAIASLANRTLRLMRSRGAEVSVGPIARDAVTIYEGYLGECYGAFTPESLNAVRLAAEYGITLECTYSGKAFAALRDFASKRAPGSGPLLFWNTFNNRDLSALAEAVDPSELPAPFHRFFQDQS